MRIIAGKYGSRSIRSVEGMTTRPTTDKVKEAVFSSLGSYFDGGEMLDLFAGSGAISLEAISRGMGHAYMVDRDYKAISIIRENIQSLDASPHCTIWKMQYSDALRKAAKSGLQFNLVYLDPPYKQQRIMDILLRLDALGLVKQAGMVICESLKEDVFANDIACFEKVKDVIYGITRITYYRKRREDE